MTILIVGLCATVSVTGLPVAPDAAASTPPHTIDFSIDPGTGSPGHDLLAQPVVHVRDVDGHDVSGVNVTLALQTVSADNHRLPPTLSCDHLTVTTDSDGKASFDHCQVSGGGLYTLKATNSVNAVSGVSDQFFVSGPAKLAFTAQPQDDAAGATWTAQPTVQIEDAHGQLVADDSTEVGLVVQPATSAAGSWTPLDCETNALAADGGVAAFTGCKIVTAGAGYTLYALDQDDDLVSTASDAFNISAASAHALVFTKEPVGAPGGHNFLSQPEVTALDSHGNPATGFNGAITLSITGGTGTAGANLDCATNPVTAVNGVATFTGCDIDLTGSGYTLTAENASGDLTVDSAAFAVTAGSVAHVTFDPDPANAKGGTAFGVQPVVNLTDAGGNPVDGTVTLAIKSGGTSGAVLACDTNPLPTSGGSASFSGCQIDQNGDGYVLRATAGGQSGDSQAFDVSSGDAGALSFSSTPAAGDGGEPFGHQPAVHVTDSGGNNASGSVLLSIADGTGAPHAHLNCAANPVSASGGTATFSDCSIDTAGHGYRLTATLVGDDTVVTSSDPFDVGVGDPVALAFTNQPGGGSGGLAWAAGDQPVVTVVDAGGNPVHGAAVDVSLAVTDGSGDGAIDCQDNPAPTQLGVARFENCSIDLHGSHYTLTASATVGGSTRTVVSHQFAVTVGDPARLLFTTSPDGAVAGSAFTTQPDVAIVDKGGNVVTSDAANVALSITPQTGTAGAVLGCSSTDAQQGVASFGSCSIDQAGGGYTLTARDATDHLRSESRTFPVLLPAPTPLEAAPVGIPVGQTLGGRLYADNPTATVDHVNSATGSLTFASTDMHVAGIGMPLDFERSYNSADSAGGSLGRGWSSLLDISVTVVPKQTMTVRGEDGQQLVWTWDAPTSRWVAPPGAHAQLTCGAKTCKLIRDDGMRWDVNLTSNGRGEIADYVAPDGFGLTFAWTASTVKITVGAGTHPWIVNGTLDSSGRLTRLASPTRHVDYSYTAGGLLSQVKDVTGHTWTYSYADGLLTRVTDPNGAHRLDVTYANSGRVATLRAGGSNRHLDDTFGWTDNGNTQTATRSALMNVGGSETREDFRDVYKHNVLLSQTLPTGGVTRYSYDDALHLIESQNAAGWYTQYKYDNAGNLVTEVSPISSTQAQVIRMAYDGQHRITSQTDADGNTSTYVYNGPWLGSLKPPGENNTQWLRFNYDKLGRLIQSLGPQHQRVFTYDDHGNQTSVKLLDLAGNAIPNSGKTTTTYDEMGDRTSMTDALGRVTTWTYDNAGHLLTLDPPGPAPVTSYDYDAAGDLVGNTDAAGHHAVWSWDESSLTRTMTVDGDPRTEQRYDPSGSLLKDESAVTHQGSTYTYDAAGRNVSQTDAAGVTTTYDYDLVDNMTGAADSAGRVFTQQFDALNRPIRKVLNGRESSLRYDPVGNVIRSTDAQGNVTSFGYNAVNAISSAETAAGITRYGYDTAGNLTSMTDPGGHVTTYSYDALARRTKTVAGGGTTTYGYDAGDRITKTVDPDGRTTTSTYDDVNEVTKTVYTQSGHPSITVNRGYDALGRITSMDDAVPHSYVYDANGNMTQATAGGDTFHYDYSTAGQVNETYPDGTHVTYGLDDGQNVMSVQSGQKGDAGYVVVSYLRNSLRQTTGIAFSNGVLETRQLNTAGDVLDQTLSVGGTVAAQDAFTYDSGGNPLSQVDSVDGTVTTNKYGYDGAGRLNAFSTSTDTGGPTWPDVSALDPSHATTPDNPPTTFAPAFDAIDDSNQPNVTPPATSLTYDADGNRRSTTTGGATSYSYNANDQLATRTGADGNATYSYDKSGNLTKAIVAGQTTTYGYDAAGRLTSVTLPGAGGTITYGYDGDGNRVSKTKDGATTEYVWDPANPLPQLDIERHAGGGLIRRYLYGDGPVAMQTPSATYFFHLDPQGNVTELTNADGSFEAAYHYDAWGNVGSVDGNGHNNPLRFQHEFFDKDTGLYYMRARNYDPTTGRFTQRDPLAAAAGAPVVSPYPFANDRPTSLGDPSGMTTESDALFDAHNSTEANVGSDVNLGVGGIKAGIGAYKGYVKLSEMLSPKAASATETLSSSVGSEARAASAGVAELGSAEGAIGKLGAAAGEGASSAEALEGAGKALKVAGYALAVAGIALQTYITVEDCIHDTALVCAADVVGLTIAVAFTVGCEFASAGAATVICGLVGAALSIAIPMIIKEWGPQIVSGLTTAYNATADALVAGAGIVADAIDVGINALTDAAETAVGAIVNGYNTAVAALSSGYETVISTLVDAGYSAVQLAKTLANEFVEGAQGAISTLVDFGYEVGDIALALKDAFVKTAGQVAELLKDTFNYTVAEVAGALESAYNATVEELATALQFAEYAVDQVARGLQSALDATSEAMTTALHAIGYGINQIAAALEDVYTLADQEVAALFHDLEATLNYAVNDVAAALQTVFNDVDAAAAAALQFASYAVDQIAGALDEIFHDAAAVAAQVLDGLNYAVDEIAGVMSTVYDLLDQATAQILQNLGKAADVVAEALVSVFADAEQAVTDVLRDVGYAITQVTAALDAAFDAISPAAIAGYLNTAGYELNLIAGAIGTVFEEAAAAVINTLRSAAIFTINAIASAVGTAFTLGVDEVASALKAAGLAAGEALEDVANTIASVLHDVYNQTAEQVAALFKGALDFSIQTLKVVLGAIYDVGEDILGGILSAAGWAADEIQKLGGALLNFGEAIGDALEDGWDAFTSLF